MSEMFACHTGVSGKLTLLSAIDSAIAGTSIINAFSAAGNATVQFNLLSTIYLLLLYNV